MAPAFTLYTDAGNPNGFKTTLIFEELKAAYPSSELDYEIRTLDTSEGVEEHKSEWYKKINSVGRLPLIVHHRSDGTDFTVWETAAILYYLVQRFDWDYRVSFPSQSEFESDSLQWMFFSHAGVAPMQGQAFWFFNNPHEKIPTAITRYLGEVKRVYNILDTRLNGRDYFVGAGKGAYSIADVNVYPWVRVHEASGLKDIDAYPNLKRWAERISTRPAVLATEKLLESN
ncbi:glutathione S-transferase-like protein [Clavulina sp. PMI_390]|nr:glutathione S-transferase-like protein [Clavulina sp. PMI_390]